MTIGSLFSGIGGLELGLERAGLGPVRWQVEIDHWCRGVLAMHWPDAVRYDDVRRVGAANLEPVEVICGGFPCQDISQAGKGAGLSGARSGLWREFHRIVGELRPRAVVVENVRALVARGLDRVVADLDGLGYRVEGRIIAARDVGAPHKRERLFVLAYARNDGREERGAWHDERRGDAPGEDAHRRDPRVADADGERVRVLEQRVPGRRARGLRDGGQGEPAHRGASRGRDPEPCLGRGAHGVPSGLDRWPARPGDAPAIWEPPRSTSIRQPTASRRLHALGNAVVPQVAEVVGRRVVELLGAR